MTNRTFRYIIASSLGSLLFELLTGFGHPLPLFPYPFMRGGGPLQWLNFSQTGYIIYTEIIGCSAVVMVYSNASMFVFRYGQTVDSRRLKKLADPRFGFGFAAATISVVCVGTVLPLSYLWTTSSPDQILQETEALDPILYELIKDKPFLGLEVDTVFPRITPSFEYLPRSRFNFQGYTVTRFGRQQEQEYPGAGKVKKKIRNN